MCKFKLITVSLAIIFLFSSCFNNSSIQNTSKSEDNNIINDSESQENIYSKYHPKVIKSNKTFKDKTQLTFVTDFDYELDENIVDELNKKLDKDGYDFAVNFVNIDSYKMSPIDFYEESLSSDENNIDILMTSGEISNEIIKSDPDTYKCKPHENTYWECVNKGYFVSLNSYFKTQEGKKLYNTFNKKYWGKSMDNNGNIYGLYTSYLSDQPTTLMFDKSIAKKYDFNYSKFDGNISSLENILEKIKNKTGSAGLVYSDINDSFYNIVSFSKLCDGIYINETNGKSENIFDNTLFKEYAKIMSDFSQKGYLKSIDNIQENNEILCMISSYSPFFADDHNEEIVISNAYQNNNYLNCGLGIVSSSKHKDEAFQLLSLLFSNRDYANLITCGIEGVNHTINENNYAVLNNQKPPFYGQYDYFVVPANPFMSKPVETMNGKDYYNKNELFNKMYNNILKSKAYGFSYLKSEKTNAIKKIYEKYEGLYYGQFEDVDETLKKANDELKKAGIDEVLADVNCQLDEFYKNNSLT